MKKELVSCVIPTYKRSDTLLRAVNSVLNQTYENVEVIIVDDNEPDDEYSIETQKKIELIKDARVRYVKQEKHVNGAVARNVGIKCAQGEFVAFLDDDDEWLPTKIEHQMKLFMEDNSIDAVTSLWMLYDNGMEVRRCPQYTSDNLQFKVFLREVAVYTSTLVIKKAVVEKFGGFDEHLLRHQDLQFLVDALNEAKFEVLNEYLVCLHADSNINRPNVYKLIDAKKAFFASVNNSYMKYDRKMQKRIKNAHNYEVAFQALKSKNIFVAMQYILKSGINITSINDLIKRMKARG